MALEHGSGRQIWLGADYTTAKPFLIRDDASNESAAPTSRNIRLGTPIDAGITSNWRQASWEGGFKQDDWRDEQMFQLSDNIDVCTTPGTAKLFPGWQFYMGEPDRGVSRYIMCPSPSGFNADVELIVGENNQFLAIDGVTGTTTPGSPAGWTLKRVNNAGTVTTITTGNNGSITAIGRIDQAGSPEKYFLVATTDGKVFLYRADTWVNALGAGVAETGNPLTAGRATRAIVPFNGATYLAEDNKLWKRTWNDGALTTTYTLAKQFTNAAFIMDVKVWNNRLYIITVAGGNRATVHVSDGATTTTAFDIPGEFFPHKMAVHYGSLYIAGSQRAAQSTLGAQGQVWRFNGASLSLLHTNGTDLSSHDNSVYAIAPWGRYLAIGHSVGGTSAGVMLYDPERDALIPGPRMINDSASGATNQVRVTDLQQWGFNLAASFYDPYAYGSGVNQPIVLAVTRPSTLPANKGFASPFANLSFGCAANTAPNTTGYVVSSVYQSTLPDEPKSFLNARMYLKTPTDTSVTVYVSVDGGAFTAVDSGSVTSAGGTSARWVTVPLKVSGAYVKGRAIQYKLVYGNSSASVDSTGVAEVYDMNVSFVSAALPRRQWHYRVYADDNQTLLSGSANSYTTADAITGALRTIWQAGVPLYMWNTGLGATAPTTNSNAVTVFPSADSWSAQTYRLTSPGSEHTTEVSMTFVEVI